MRAEMPWVTRAPSENVRDHVRFTVQPIDAPDEMEAIMRLIDHLACDELFLFSTDYPHWQFDGDEALPSGISRWCARRSCATTAQATYPRLAKATGPWRPPHDHARARSRPGPGDKAAGD